MTRPHRNRLIELHSAALLFGLTGLFGKFLQVSPLMIVLGRSFFAAAALAVYLSVSRRWSDLRQGWRWIIFSGLTLAFHWVSFFQSVQVSTVAVAVLTFSTSPVFSTLLEPIFFKERWNPATLLPVLMVIVGVVGLTPGIGLNNHIVAGAIWGIGSGLSFAIYTMLNRRQVRGRSPQMLSFGQNMVVAIAMLLAIPFCWHPIGIRDLSLMAVLGILCTAVAQSLYISSLRGVSAQLACIVSTLESPYGILFALLMLGEIPSARTVIGGMIILAAAVTATLMQRSEPGGV